MFCFVSSIFICTMNSLVQLTLGKPMRVQTLNIYIYSYYDSGRDILVLIFNIQVSYPCIT